MTPNTLFSALELGPHRLSHRVVMPPLTRMRAQRPGNVPGANAAEYYGQRATAGGLIISEGAQISPTGQGVPATPGIHSPEQIAGWKKVVEAVHAKGGFIFLQLWHVGRISHNSLQPGGALPVAPSAVAAEGEAFTADFRRVPFETPRALESTEIPALVESYAAAARNAMEAGFDGVEIHSANGYLLEQFLHPSTNLRTDGYGDGITGRSRLVLEVVDAVVAVWGAGRVGIRLSPFGIGIRSSGDDPMPLYTYLVGELAKRKLTYLHLIEPRASGAGMADVDHKDVPLNSELFRPMWPGVLIAAGNYDRNSAMAAVESGRADAISFGRHFIANPDLPERLRRNVPLTPYNRATFYGGGAQGYTDYPAFAGD